MPRLRRSERLGSITDPRASRVGGKHARGVAAVLGAVMIAALAGCSVDIDYEGTRFSCSDGVCPGGYDCIDEVCVGFSGPDGDAPSCQDRFAEARDYELCFRDDDLCAFATTTEGNTCNQVCESFGSFCVAALSNADVPCESDGGDSCDDSRDTEICLCDL